MMGRKRWRTRTWPGMWMRRPVSALQHECEATRQVEAMKALLAPQQDVHPHKCDGWGMHPYDCEPVKNDCHPRCSLGPRADHPGYLGYRCITESVAALPWPGEDGYAESLTRKHGGD